MNINVEVIEVFKKDIIVNIEDVNIKMNTNINEETPKEITDVIVREYVKLLFEDGSIDNDDLNAIDVDILVH
jgi:hypothetical protein